MRLSLLIACFVTLAGLASVTRIDASATTDTILLEPVPYMAID